MKQNPAALKESPSQTAGPYVHIGCMPNHAGISIYGGADLGATMKTGPVKGTEITLRGTVFDGDGTPLHDAMVELWQADAAGLYPSRNETRGKADPNFTGFGRASCDPETGLFVFETVKPGPVPSPDGALMAPHATLWIAARGINLGLPTRVYFEDEAEANSEDPILTQIAPKSRVSTLLAKPEGNGAYRFDVHLQGPTETVFFNF